MEPIHPVIVIADMHFGYRDTKIKKESFMSLMSMAHLAGAEVVFLGDTFDLWRRKDSEIMEYNKECLDCISVDATFISGNHDLTICGQESYHIYGKNKKAIPSVSVYSICSRTFPLLLSQFDHTSTAEC